MLEKAAPFGSCQQAEINCLDYAGYSISQLLA